MNKFISLVAVLIQMTNTLSAEKTNSFQSGSADDSVNLIEKVYLHSDRDTYYTGEDVWFKAYLVDALDHTLTDNSRNLHVELISPGLKILSSRVIRLENGLGNGDIRLPADISSGRYIIRAYTNYMRNFSDKLFFTKEITVINVNGVPENTPDKVKYAGNNISLNFFPEGGSLVDNVESIVAFKAVDYLGMGCEVSGKVYSSDGDLITSFRSSHRGMGSFLFRPSPGKTYYSIVRGSDSVSFKTELPVSFEKGATLSVSKNQGSELIVSIKTNPGTLPVIAENDLLLTISIRGEVINSIPLRITSLVNGYVIPTGYLPEGILMLTLTGAQSVPFSERLVYLEKDIPSGIQIETDKYLYNKREPVNLKISLPGDSISESEGNISLAVVNEIFTKNASQHRRTISSWFLLESDVHGEIEDPSYYFDPANAGRLKNLDLLLCTQGWRDFAWKYDTVNYPVENGFTISGRLRETNKNQLPDDTRVSIGIFGDRNSLVTNVPVDSGGRFELPDIDFMGKATLIASGIGNEKLTGFMTLDSAKYSPAQISDIPVRRKITSVETQSSFKSYYLVSESIKRKYKLADTIAIGEVNIIAERNKDPQTVKVEKVRSKYVTPDAELRITEQMLGYQDVFQLLRSRVPGVEVIIDPRGGAKIYIRGVSSIKAINPPLILIDGVPINGSDTSNDATVDLPQIPISIIDRIDILKSVFTTNVYGILGANGVINIITKAGGAGNYNPPEHTVKIRISGYDTPRIFYSPQHPDSDADYKPDLRNTLLWNPDVNLEGNTKTTLNFYNGDNSATIRIIAEGITSEGIPVTGEAQYEVR